jgi:hypothetical protein
MIRKFVEGDLLFEFDEELWRPLESWDKHAAYRTGIREVGKAKAVDFIGVYRNPESPWVEFEYKVRNTIAGLVGSGRREGYASVCIPFLDALLKPQELKLVYWVELPPLSQASSVIRKRHVATAGFAARQTGRLMKWLDARAFTVSQENDYERLVPGLKVKNLPRKRRELAEAIENRLRSRGINIGDGAKHRISQERDLEVLEDWCDRAATVSTAEELFGGYQ